MSKKIQIDHGTYNCYASIDCTDIVIEEPTPFSSNWCSPKYNRAAVRYEMATSISGSIVWIYGPFMAGSDSELKIFQSRLKQKLLHDEIIVGDSAYKDVKCTYDDGADKQLLDSIRARQETVFSRLKSFNILRCSYRHRLSMHSNVMFVVANLVQTSIEKGECLLSL